MPSEGRRTATATSNAAIYKKGGLQLTVNHYYDSLVCLWAWVVEGDEFTEGQLALPLSVALRFQSCKLRSTLGVIRVEGDVGRWAQVLGCAAVKGRLDKNDAVLERTRQRNQHVAQFVFRGRANNRCLRLCCRRGGGR